MSLQKPKGFTNFASTFKNTKIYAFKIHEAGKAKHIFTSICTLPYFIIYICILKFLFYRSKVCLSIGYIIIAKCQLLDMERKWFLELNLARTFAFLGFIFPRVERLLDHNYNSNNDLNVQSALSFRVLSHMLPHVMPMTTHCPSPTHSDISLADDL